MTSVGQEAANDYGSSLPKGGIALTQSAPLVCLSPVEEIFIKILPWLAQWNGSVWRCGFFIRH